MTCKQIEWHNMHTPGSRLGEYGSPLTFYWLSPHEFSASFNKIKEKKKEEIAQNLIRDSVWRRPKIVPDVRDFAVQFGQFVRDDFRKHTLYGYAQWYRRVFNTFLPQFDMHIYRFFSWLSPHSKIWNASIFHKRNF